MPRRSRWESSSSFRHRRAKTIQSAWRARKRRKVGLVQRTLESNRRQIKQIKKAPEVKFLQSANSQYGSGDVDIDGVTTAGAPVTFNLCSGVAVGAANGERIGREVTVKRISCHVRFSPPAGIAAESANRCTAVLVHDSEPETGGGNPTIQDLMSLPTANYTLNTGFYNPSHVGKSGDKRYQVLARKTIWVGSQPNCMPEGYLNLHTSAPYKINYGTDQSAGAFGINQTVRLFLYSDSGVAPHPRYNVAGRFSYTG